VCVCVCVCELNSEEDKIRDGECEDSAQQIRRPPRQDASKQTGNNKCRRMETCLHVDKRWNQ
jgi:hypothetical protein